MSSLIDAALPASVTAEVGRGGLPKLSVVAPSGASAEVYLQGAHVTSWAPPGHDDVLWLSEHSAFAPGAPIRGGVPICFPWFGPHAAGGPLHGFARITPWTVASAVEQGDDVVLALTLGNADVRRDAAAWWPHRFRATYRVTVGATLGLELEVTNTDEAAITVAEAFHTYLAVGDVQRVRITGLEDVAGVDRLTASPLAPAGVPLAITAETDRVYAQPGTIAVADPAAERTLEVVATGSADAVVWNPWAAKAAAMADFGDDEWREMLCVETCNVFDNAVLLEPGASHTMAATLHVAPA